MKNKKILYFVSEDWYFISHRLSLALEAKKMGYKVYLITRVNSSQSILEKNGIKVFPIKINRGKLNILQDLFLIIKLYNIIKKNCPDIIHNVSLKPIVLGTIVGNFAKIKVINTLPGLGYVNNTSKNFFQIIIKYTVKYLLKFCLKNLKSKIVVQNKRDLIISKDLFKSNKNQLFLISGSGVDCNFYYPQCKSKSFLRVSLISRMIWDKGIKDFVEAARCIKLRYPKVLFTLVGKVDNENKNYIPLDYLKTLNNEGFVEWVGFKNDIRRILKKTHIACLPTFYSEGLPKFLLEANAMSTPVVCTDNPGCTELVKHNYNGIVIPERNVKKLIEALTFLIEEPSERLRMGTNGRKLVLKKFELKLINKEYIKLY